MKVRELTEAPYLHDGELGYVALSSVSKNALDRTYEHLASFEGFDLFAKKPFGFIVGRSTDKGDLNVMLSITCRKPAFPVEPRGLDDYQQVSMVRVSTGFKNEGVARTAYTEIAKRVDLVSDHEQYLSAQGLWKSLARNNVVNVYVYSNEKYQSYNGKNISDKQIWGETTEHLTVLLIATTKELR